MQNFWDERYSQDGYAYGIMPNSFFAEELPQLKSGSLLLPAEGEGRNAIYAAQQGWKVTAFDSSKKGIEKAHHLANVQKVSINYQLSSYDKFEANPDSFDCLALIYAHITDGNRSIYHKRFLNWLKPGGKLILEAFSKEQINFNSGGPKNIEFLYSEEELRNDFDSLKAISIITNEISLNEGTFHKGKASVIRLVGTK